MQHTEDILNLHLLAVNQSLVKSYRSIYSKQMINKDRIVQTLLDLIKIDSPSGEEDAIVEDVKLRLKVLGASVTTDDFGNVIASMEGEGEPLILSAHLDTVEPGRGIKPKIAGDLITSDGSTILGADPKAGLAIILEALTSVREQGNKTVPIEVVLTRDEETGSKGAQNLNHSLSKASRAAVFDGDEAVTHVNNAAPGYYAFDLSIIGRSAHAGLEPEKGISAITIAAEVVNKLTTGRIDEETTSNIGTISGGSARNAVAEKAELKGEFRSRNADKLNIQVENFKKIIAEVSKNYTEAKLSYQLNKHFDSFSIPQDDAFIQQLITVFESMGLSADIKPTGGGSDANFFNAKNIRAVVIGTGVRNMHTTKESLTISEMVQAAQFAERLISK
jgi:tripeptide aminopeptidase